MEELVANAFDAGAKNVQVILSPNLHEQDATIVVIDDGEGMGVEGLKQHWLIGISNKRRLGDKLPMERQQIGERDDSPAHRSNLPAAQKRNHMVALSFGSDYDATRRLRMKNTDRIERSVMIQAPRTRVWKALTDANEFGTWFRVALDAEFAVGKRRSGKMTYPGHEGAPFFATVERMEPEHLFSFRWPMGSESPTEADADSGTTLVEFRLEDAPEGTKLTVTESGFDRLPAKRRIEAYRGNSEGWAIQMENIRRHVEV